MAEVILKNIKKVYPYVSGEEKKKKKKKADEPEKKVNLQITDVRHIMEYSDLYVQRIRKLCKERGIAINKLATMSDVKQSTLDNIVRGLTKNPRVKTLHKIALAFNMTLAEFLDFKELNEYSFEDDDEE